MINNKITMKDEAYKNFKNLSHELKAPVANLNLVLETLYEYDKTLSVCRKKEILQLGLAETKRLQDLIYYFLYFNYKTNSLEEVNRQLQKIDSLDEIVFVYDVLSFQKNIFIKPYVYKNKSFILINIDSKAYKNIVFNLLGNANKFIVYHGWIILEIDILTSIALASFNYTNLNRTAVIDNGVGITADIQLSIKSNSFFFFNNKQRIGLSIVKEILTTYRLLLNVVSYPHRGAKLYFDIIVNI